MADTTVHIDFAKLKEVADLAIRRASVFMGIATNVAKIDPPVSHVLDTRTIFTVYPPLISDDERLSLIAEFEKWSVGNALRELVDGFSIYLSDVYEIILLLKEKSLLDLKKESASFPSLAAYQSSSTKYAHTLSSTVASRQCSSPLIVLAIAWFIGGRSSGSKTLTTVIAFSGCVGVQ